MFGNVKELCPQDYIKAGAPGAMKRAYKLQEFVAHASNVNCLKIGKKSSRVLVTGGEDHKVNMWAIGKPNAILSLSGHSSAVESVTFDAAEVLVVAGAASGTIKLWDLEEAKIVRTLTGHRSNCIAVDFHPFGEFFASGSLDTNLKIWDIRRKGCIHTYKGHTRGVNAIKFSPDGRWVVSGGEDNIVKLWDLTAGKLMHDFKYHDGQISCLDFHPHEFLLATGSADRTVKFWDLETFELIGSAGPEASGVRSIIFNPDGRTLLCGLHENLKVFSWEPLRCHDVVDVGWSKLADLNIHEGKLLGCSFNQSCVGIWVVDLSCVGPYAVGTDHHTNSTSGGKVISHANQPAEQMVDGSLKGSNATRSALPNGLESSMKDVKLTASASSLESVPSTPQRGTNSMSASKVSNSVSSAAPAYLVTPRRMGVARVQPVSGVQAMNRSDTVPVIVPRHGTSLEPAGMVIARPVLENSAKPHTSSTISVKATELGKVGGFKECLGNDNLRVDSNRPADLDSSAQGPVSNERISRSSLLCPETLNRGVAAASDDDRDNIRWLGSSRFRAASPGTRGTPLVRSFSDDRVMPHQDGYVAATEATSAGSAGLGRARALAASLERKERALKMDMPGVNSVHGMRASVLDMASLAMKGNQLGFEKSGAVMGDDEDIVEELMQQHNNFADIMQSRLTKLQVIRRFWTKNDLKGAVEAMGKMADQAVLVDVLSALIERSDVFNLEICTLLLPLLNDLLSSEFERYLSTALSILLLLVKNFGQVIHTTRSASPFFGVDLHAEERFERCNTCYIEMQNVMQKLTPLLRKGGDIGKSAQDLSIALQEV